MLLKQIKMLIVSYLNILMVLTKIYGLLYFISVFKFTFVNN